MSHRLDQYITFCQITCSRNLKDFPFFSRMSEKDYSDVEKKVKSDRNICKKR